MPKLALALVSLSTSLLAVHGALAQSIDRSADEKAVKAVIQAFLDKRDANDAAGLSALLTADADQQQTSGAMRRGRDAVVTGSLATQRSTGGKRTISVDSVRFVAADVAIADGRYDSVGRADGSDRHMLTSMVLRREAGRWKIAAIRNMLPSTE
jgi:uncharacterized protein (TIGR02246 family)